MFKIHHFRFSDDTAIAHTTTARTTLSVTRGVLWVTMEGDATDYWLEAGASLTVPAERRLWLSADHFPTVLELAQTLPHQKRVRPRGDITLIARQS
ncbi:DUF2917 domain-containing protein [Robbsia andropogonis]|uniref:DUF2917 domain-containing protein n=1 Tax=Robbsia andropogonis TaxID=28092 RepID=UPI003D1ED306